MPFTTISYAELYFKRYLIATTMFAHHNNKRERPHHIFKNSHSDFGTRTYDLYAPTPLQKPMKPILHANYIFCTFVLHFTYIFEQFCGLQLLLCNERTLL